MNKKKLISKILTVVVAGGVILSTGSLTFAKDNISGATGSTVKKQQARMNKQNQTQNMKSALDKLVTTGTITTDQETKVLEYITAQQTAKQVAMEKVKNMTKAECKAYFESNKLTEKTEFLSELVTAGTLTQDQATDINNAVHQGRDQKQPGANTEQVKTELDALVTDGTITQDQETTILASITQQQTDRQAEMEKVKNMTEAERKAYFESKTTTEKTNFLTSLVTAGTITQAQANTVAKIIHKGPGRKELGGNPAQVETQLNALVTAGTITQDEATNILKYLTENQTVRQTEMDKVKNMTEAERKTYFKNNKKEKTNLFSELVTAGIISQDKVDAIKAAMPTQKDHN